ncbi:MAG TPA: T9SS type A sorting domain-containing protein [Bacteroidia bacterium]|jgi:hypothetical protein
MNKKLLLFSVIAILLVAKNSYSNSCTTNGGAFASWAALTWTCTSAPAGGPPTCGDVMNVAAGTTVSISADVDYSACASPIALNIFGTMNFPDGGVRFKLPAGSTVFVASGGTIGATFTGGGSSTLISVGGQNVWTAGMGTINGPMVLPVELLSFKGKSLLKSVQLEWVTATEIINDYFTIEKTRDGSNFEIVTTVDGAGNSTSINSYVAYDTDPQSGVNYYRLKQTDFNGQFTYFETISVDFQGSEEFSLKVFPNPNQGGDFNIVFQSEEGDDVMITIYDAMGKMSHAKAIKAIQGENIYSIDPEENLSSGLYMVRAVKGENSSSMPMIIK